MAKRMCSFALAVVFLFCVFFFPLAQPAHAFAGTIVVGAVIAVMAMAGISLVAAGVTSTEIQQWVDGKLSSWATARGSTVEQLISTSLIGTTFSGLLMIGKAAADGINDFISWLKTDLGLGDNDSYHAINNPGGTTLSDYFDFPDVYGWTVDGDVITYNAASNISVFNWTAKNADHVSFDAAFSVYDPYAPSSGLYIIGTGIYATTYTSVTFSNLVNCAVNGSGTRLTPNQTTNPTIGSYHINAIASQGNVQLGCECDVARAFYQMKIMNLVVDNTNVSSPSSSLMVNTGVVTLPTVQTGEQIFIDVGALPGTTVQTVTDGIITDVTDNSLTVSGEVATEEPEIEITGPLPIYGLAEVFPFCIPFDIYSFLNVLAADPVAPHFEWRLYVEGLVDYTFVIDLAAFETAAVILRTMFLLLFCVGLAAVTRQLIRS